MGSCENKHWQKKWLAIKPATVLTVTQQSMIVGSLLGDGTMRMGHKATNANFKVEHGLVQKQYVFWKYSILQPWVFTEPRISFRYRPDRTRYEKSWWFRTIRHPILTKLYRRFYTVDNYRTGRKKIPQNISHYLDPLAMAIWIMDDGSYSREKIDISTYSFLLSEIIVLQKAIHDRFGIVMNYYRDRDKGYRMYASKTETQKLVSVVYPHIITSMMYKIGFHNPVTTRSKTLVKSVEVKMAKLQNYSVSP